MYPCASPKSIWNEAFHRNVHSVPVGLVVFARMRQTTFQLLMVKGFYISVIHELRGIKSRQNSACFVGAFSAVISLRFFLFAPLLDMERSCSFPARSWNFRHGIVPANRNIIFRFPWNTVRDLLLRCRTHRESRIPYCGHNVMVLQRGVLKCSINSTIW